MKTFNNSQELYEAGYAAPLYDNLENKTRWRYFGDQFITDGPPLLCEQVTLRQSLINVRKVEELLA